jgi:hypothetical protein
MAKTEVYSWRVEPATKEALEEEARRHGLSMAALLERVANGWLASRRGAEGDDESEHARLRRSLLDAVGTIGGGDPERSTRARPTIRRRLVKASGR